MSAGATGLARVPEAPAFYRPVGNECEIFETAFAQRVPLLLKGPTGCGKSRLVEHMAARLGRPHPHPSQLIENYEKVCYGWPTSNQREKAEDRKKGKKLPL